MNKKIKTIDEYIKTCPKDRQAVLKKLVSLIKKIAPKAEADISYGMPAFKLNGPLVYFACMKNHVGFYPTPSAIKAFQKEVSKFKWSKGAVQFPQSKPLPWTLISRMVKFKLKENSKKNNKTI